MFTWICPQCGREVPPAYNECPDCVKPPAQYRIWLLPLGEQSRGIPVHYYG